MSATTPTTTLPKSSSEGRRIIHPAEVLDAFANGNRESLEDDGCVRYRLEHAQLMSLIQRYGNYVDDGRGSKVLFIDDGMADETDRAVNDRRDRKYDICCCGACRSRRGDQGLDTDSESFEEQYRLTSDAIVRQRYRLCYSCKWGMSGPYCPYCEDLRELIKCMESCGRTVMVESEGGKMEHFTYNDHHGRQGKKCCCFDRFWNKVNRDGICDVDEEDYYDSEDEYYYGSGDEDDSDDEEEDDHDGVEEVDHDDVKEDDMESDNEADDDEDSDDEDCDNVESRETKIDRCLELLSEQLSGIDSGLGSSEYEA